MSIITRLIILASAAASLAACAQREEEVVFVEPAPIVSEPSFSKF